MTVNVKKWKGFYQRGESDFIFIPNYIFKTMPVRLVDINRTPKEVLLKKTLGVVSPRIGFFTDQKITQDDFFVLKNIRGDQADFFKKFKNYEFKGSNVIYNVTNSPESPEDKLSFIGGLAASIYFMRPEILIIKLEDDMLKNKIIFEYLDFLRGSTDLIIYIFPRIDDILNERPLLRSYNLCVSNITLSLFPDKVLKLVGNNPLALYIEGIKEHNKYFFKTTYSESALKLKEEDYENLNEVETLLILTNTQDYDLVNKEISENVIP